jgi:hypothetical protein
MTRTFSLAIELFCSACHPPSYKGSFLEALIATTMNAIVVPPAFHWPITFCSVVGIVTWITSRHGMTRPTTRQTKLASFSVQNSVSPQSTTLDRPKTFKNIKNTKSTSDQTKNSTENSNLTPEGQPPIEPMLTPVLPLPDPPTQETWMWTSANVADYLLDIIKKHKDETPDKTNDPDFARAINTISQIYLYTNPTTGNTPKPDNQKEKEPEIEILDEDDEILTPDQAKLTLSKANLLPQELEPNVTLLSGAIERLVILTDNLPKKTIKELKAISYLLDQVAETPDLPTLSPKQPLPEEPRSQTIEQSQQSSSPPLSEIPPTPPRHEPAWLQEAEISAQILDEFLSKNCRPTDNTPHSSEIIKKLNVTRKYMESATRTINSTLQGQHAPKEEENNTLIGAINKLLTQLKNTKPSTNTTIPTHSSSSTTMTSPSITTPSTNTTPNPAQGTKPKPPYNQVASKQSPDTTSKANKQIPNTMAKTNKQNSNPTTNQPAQPPPKPTRYVLRFHGNPPLIQDRMTSERAMSLLNSKLQEHEDTKGKVTVIGVAPKPNGNYIISFTNDSPIEIIERHKDTFRSTLAHDFPHTTFSKDEPWTRIIVHSVPRNDQNNNPRTEDQLLTAIKINPALKGIKITQPPRWLKSEDLLTDKKAAAITFAFVQIQDETTKRILNNPFFMFGTEVRTELWKDKPKPIQCKKCWRTNHLTKQCSSPITRCRKCGKKGSEDEHPVHCDQCPKDRTTDAECPHLWCPNCHGNDHAADDPRCTFLHFNSQTNQIRQLHPNARSRQQTTSNP